MRLKESVIMPKKKRPDRNGCQFSRILYLSYACQAVFLKKQGLYDVLNNRCTRIVNECMAE